MRRTLLLGVLGVSVACGSLEACGGSGTTPVVESDAGENGTTDHDASTLPDASPGEDSSTLLDASTGDAHEASTTDASNDTSVDATDDVNSDAAGDANDDGSSDAAGDAPSDAPVSCVGTDTACTVSGQPGLCKGGVCAACADPADDSACTTAYATDGGPTAYVCAAGACVPGNCHSSATCAGKLCANNSCTGCADDNACIGDPTYGSGTICTQSGGTCVSNACATANAVCPSSAAHFCCAVPGAGVDAGTVNACVAGNCCSNVQCGGATPACTGNTCLACDANTSNTWVVDPVNGSDSRTGSGTAGGVANAACAFKTITKAIQAINAAALLAGDGGPGTPAVGTKIVVQGPAVASAGETFPLVIPENVRLEGTGGVTIANTTGTLVSATKPGVVLANVQIDGSVTSGVCIDASAGSLSLESVDIRRCTVGLRANATAAVTIKAGSHVHENGIGIRAQASAQVTLVSATNQILVDKNTTAGVLVVDQAGLTVNGDANSETILLRENGVGLWFTQAATSALPLSAVTGLVAKANLGAGIELNAGSAIKLRSSISTGNLYGVQIIQGTTTGLENDTSGLDLGTAVGTDPGGNTLQTPTGASPNTGAGLCIQIQPQKSQVIRVRGNKFASGDHATSVDCNVTVAAIGSTSTCTSAVNVGGQGLNGNTLQIDNCSP